MSVATQSNDGFNERIGKVINEEALKRLLRWIALQIDDDAADIAQEACHDFIEAVHSKPEILESESWARNLLYTIARRRIVDFLRQKKRRPTATLAFEPLARPEEDWEVVEEIRKSLDKDRLAKILNERELDVLWSTRYEGKADESVARRLGITPVNVRKIRSRAIKKIRDALGS